MESIAQPAPTQNDVMESTRELVSEVARLDNLIDLHLEEFRRVKGQRDALLAALTVSRGQWIHSVNAAQCLAAIAKAQAE